MAKKKRSDEPTFRLPPYRIEGDIVLSLSETIDWWQKIIGLPALWKENRGDGERVAILDTGWDQTHPDLKGAVVAERDFTRSPVGVYDRNRHGTWCAGAIGARANQVGVRGGVQSELIIGKVLSDSGSGQSKWIANGIKWAVDQGATVISMSLGSARPSPLINRAIDDVPDDIMIVCAAGNAGPSLDTDGWPARHPKALSVGGMDKNHQVPDFSSRGQSVDIIAPAVDVLSTVPGGYARMTGTSMACPIVASVVAMVQSKHKIHGGKTPIRNVKDLRDHLRKTAIDMGPPGRDPHSGFGLINPAKLLYANGETPPPDAVEGEEVVVGGKRYRVETQLVLKPVG